MLCYAMLCYEALGGPGATVDAGLLCPVWVRPRRLPAAGKRPAGKGKARAVTRRADGLEAYLYA